MSDDFFIHLERQLEAAELREFKRAPALRRFGNPRRLLAVPLAAAAAAAAVIAVLAGLGAIGSDDAERDAQPVGAVPGPKIVAVAAATGVDGEVSFSLENGVLTVVLRGDELYDTVSGAQVSATCGEATRTRRWPTGEDRTSFRFAGDASKQCRLEDRSGRVLASAALTGPGVPTGAAEQITEIANNWARHFAATNDICNEDTVRTFCGNVDLDAECEGDCTPGGWAREHRGATVQRIAISGDRAAAMLASPEGVEVQMLQLRRTATGEWLIEGLGSVGAVGSPD